MLSNYTEIFMFISTTSYQECQISLIPSKKWGKKTRFTKINKQQFDVDSYVFKLIEPDTD